MDFEDPLDHLIELQSYSHASLEIVGHPIESHDPLEFSVINALPYHGNKLRILIYKLKYSWLVS